MKKILLQMMLYILLGRQFRQRSSPSALKSVPVCGARQMRHPTKRTCILPSVALLRKNTFGVAFVK